MLAAVATQTAVVAATQAESSMSDAQFFLLLSFAVIVIQTLYRVWDKKDSKTITDALAAGNEKVIMALNNGIKFSTDAIEKSIEVFTPHLERNRKILGMVQELQSMHNVRDDDGRPMWYMPREIIENQRELTKLTQTIADTQNRMASIMEKQSDDFAKMLDIFKEFMNERKIQCKDQFNDLKEEIRDSKL